MAIEQTKIVDETPLGTYLGEVERYCAAIEAGNM